MDFKNETLWNSKDYPTIGNALRINDQSITRYPLTLIVHDAAHIDLVMEAEAAFCGRYPLGYIGTSPWPGSVTNQRMLPYRDRQNAMLYGYLRQQMEIGAVIYAQEAPPDKERELLLAVRDMKEKCPGARLIWMRKEGEQLSAAMEEGLAEHGVALEQYGAGKERKGWLAALGKEIEGQGPPARFDPLDREWAEWTNLSLTLPTEEKERRILLVGDSISAGYGDMVQKRMPGWHVDRLNTSEGIHHPNFLCLLRIALQGYPYHLIHINNGLHLHGQSVEQYGQRLEEIFSWIRREFAGTRIIFATTTPISRTLAKEELEGFDARHFAMGGKAPLAKDTDEKYWITDEEASRPYRELNEKAKEICARHQIPVNDLYGLCVAENLQKSDGVHFTEEAYGRLADKIAKVLEDSLQNRKQEDI